MRCLRSDAATSGTAAPKQAHAGSWAVESCKIVQTTGFYPEGRFIEQPYVDQWDPILVSRIKSAG